MWYWALRLGGGSGPGCFQLAVRELGVSQPLLLFRVSASAFRVWGFSTAASLPASGQPTSLSGFEAHGHARGHRKPKALPT